MKPLSLLALGLVLLCEAPAAQTQPAQHYPSRPLRLIVGNAPG